MKVSPELEAKILAMPGVAVSSSGMHCRAAEDRCVAWLPIVVRSKLNQRQHWAARARAAKIERREGCAAVYFFGVQSGPLTITLTRVGGRAMDDDNLAGAFKSIRDGIADGIRRDDGDKSIRWVYEQRPRRRGESAGCEVVITKGRA